LPKSNIVMVRMDETERAMVECLAARWGVSLSAAIRCRIRESDGPPKRGYSWRVPPVRRSPLDGAKAPGFYGLAR
jgi:hypothetical protein